MALKTVPYICTNPRCGHVSKTKIREDQTPRRRHQDAVHEVSSKNVAPRLVSISHHADDPPMNRYWVFTILMLIVFYSILIMGVTWALADGRYEPSSTYSQAEVELAVCIAANDRASEVLDSVEVWIHRGRR